MLQELRKDLTKVKHAQKYRSDNLQLLGGLLHNIAYVMFRSVWWLFATQTRTENNQYTETINFA